MLILGFNCYAFNAAACILRDGQLLAAAQEERFNRTKTFGGFPIRSIEYCLSAAGASIDDVDHVAFHWKPLHRFAGRIAMTIRHAPNFRDMLRSHSGKWVDLMLAERTFFRTLRPKRRIPFHRIAHHISHAASAFLVSPFEQAAILVVDGTGEMAATTLASGRGGRIDVLDSIDYPHSLGYLFVAVTHYLGFKPESDEYKLMSLASYGRSSCYDAMKKVIVLEPGGRYRVDLRYFNYQKGVRSPWVSQLFVDVFGPLRSTGAPLLARHEDIAWALQKRLEDVALHVAVALRQRTGMRNLCIAGGVGLNSVMNTRLLREAGFDDIFVQPSAFDAGCCIGSSYAVWNSVLGKARVPPLSHVLLGPHYSDAECLGALSATGLQFVRLEEAELVERTAHLIAAGRVVGWFQGRMEMGPRALGSRSILADPRRAEMKDILNDKIKHRESFRPFAPVVIEERASEFFECDRPSPFMTFVLPVRKNHAATIPAVTHVDGTARLQTVSHDQNPLFYELIRSFGEITGVPVIINTSFNVMGEPIVCTPQDAVRCFRSTGIDHLVLGNYFVSK